MKLRILETADKMHTIENNAFVTVVFEDEEANIFNWYMLTIDKINEALKQSFDNQSQE
jgi:hypothetical protein